MENENLVIRKNDRIIKFRMFKKIKRSGNGGAISMPKELIGKTVKVEYGMEEKDGS